LHDHDKLNRTVWFAKFDEMCFINSSIITSLSDGCFHECTSLTWIYFAQFNFLHLAIIVFLDMKNFPKLVFLHFS
jgi:hypothetical protein